MDEVTKILTVGLLTLTILFTLYALYIASAFRSLFKARRGEHTEEGYDDDN